MKSISIPTPQTFELVFRVSKRNSAFTYFILESHEGLCMYSTLESSLGTDYRDLHLIGSHDFRKQIDHLLGQLQKQFPIEVISSSVH